MATNTVTVKLDASEAIAYMEKLKEKFEVLTSVVKPFGTTMNEAAARFSSTANGFNYYTDNTSGSPYTTEIKPYSTIPIEPITIPADGDINDFFPPPQQDDRVTQLEAIVEALQKMVMEQYAEIEQLKQMVTGEVTITIDVKDMERAIDF